MESDDLVMRAAWYRVAERARRRARCWQYAAIAAAGITALALALVPFWWPL